MSDLRRAPFIALGLGLIITLLAFASVYRSAADANQAYFDDLVSQTELQVKNRYTLYEQSLLAGLSVFRASEHVTLADWITYTDTINVEEVLTGISGVGYIDYVREENLNSYLEQRNEYFFITKPSYIFKNRHYLIERIYKVHLLRT